MPPPSSQQPLSREAVRRYRQLLEDRIAELDRRLNHLNLTHISLAMAFDRLNNIERAHWRRAGAVVSDGSSLHVVEQSPRERVKQNEF